MNLTKPDLDKIEDDALNGNGVGSLVTAALVSLARLGVAVRDSNCDMTHNFRCESWQEPNVEGHKRRSSDPAPDDPECDCGLRDIVTALNKLSADQQ